MAAAVKSALNGILPSTSSEKPNTHVNGTATNGHHHQQQGTNGTSTTNGNGNPTFENYGFEKYKFPFKVHFCELLPPDAHPELTHYEGFKPSSTILPKGHVKAKGWRPLPCDMHYERDVTVPMRDGAKLYTDVFRPVTDEKVPAILPYSPYGKSGTGDITYDKAGPYNCGINPNTLSGYHKFEGPDPAEWTNRGYAIINIDARGSFDSEGNMMRWGPKESLDVYDTIEWIVQQPWCNGSVTMQGNSWLGVSQINHAARDCHPALKCIAPWEGHADHYRDVMVRGGIPQVAFGNWMQGKLVGRASMEDTAKMAMEHPFFDEYWATKRIPLENIDIPIYQTASYSSFIHTHGSVRTFREAKSKNKWIRIHNAQEWADLYKPHNVDDLQKFYDRYCKGLDNGWEKDTPPVRLTLISFGGKDVVERPEQEYPLARTRYETLYLDSNNITMSANPAKAETSASYEAHHMTDCLDFVYKVDKYTEIAGYPVLKLWVSCNEHNDLDIRVQIRKLDKDGKLLVHHNWKPEDGGELAPGQDEGIWNCEDVNIYTLQGFTGMLRASHRNTLNEAKSTPNEPFYNHDRSEPIAPGTVVPLTIGIWPMGMVLEAGESVVLRVAGHSLVLPEFKVMTPDRPIDFNKGKHNIHTGGQYDSHIVLPIIN